LEEIFFNFLDSNDAKWKNVMEICECNAPSFLVHYHHLSLPYSGFVKTYEGSGLHWVELRLVARGFKFDSNDYQGAIEQPCNCRLTHNESSKHKRILAHFLKHGFTSCQMKVDLPNEDFVMRFFKEEDHLAVHISFDNRNDEVFSEIGDRHKLSSFFADDDDDDDDEKQERSES